VVDRGATGSKLRVTIDATPALIRSAGVKNYTYYWIRSLWQAARDEKIRAFPFLEGFGRLDHERSTLSRSGTFSRLVLIQLLRTVGSPLLDWALRDADLFHTSNQVRCAPTRAKLTATLHDLTCWLTPELHTAANIRADHEFADRILRRADALIAVSENTRQDAIRLLGIAPERITTIYSGVSSEYFNAVPASRAKPYVLYLGTIEPRKNLDVLLDAWKVLPARLREEFDLVFAGSQGWNTQGTFARIQSEATYLGYVPESGLPGLMAGASLFVYPSLYEGFGFPVVQAMAAGVPVLTSNVSCLPEIVGDAAMLVDPKSEAEIAAGLRRLLEMQTLRLELSAKGRIQAQKYRWETCAARSLEFFHRVAGR